MFDFSPVGRTVTPHGIAFDRGSGKYVDNAASGYLAINATPDIQLTGDFTIQFYDVEFTALGIHRLMASQWGNSGERAMYAGYRTDNGGSLSFVYSTTGSDTIVSQSPWVPALLTPYHIAWSREGDTLRGFVDGIMVHKDTGVSGALHSSPVPFIVGRYRSDQTSFPAKMIFAGFGLIKEALYNDDLGFTVPATPTSV